MFRTSGGVIVRIVWLYITVAVVIILFSIIVSCLFISLSFVCVGILYDTVGTRINVVSIILLGGENISFDASLHMCVHSALGAVFSAGSDGRLSYVVRGYEFGKWQSELL